MTKILNRSWPARNTKIENVFITLEWLPNILQEKTSYSGNEFDSDSKQFVNGNGSNECPGTADHISCKKFLTLAANWIAFLIPTPM